MGIKNFKIKNIPVYLKTLSNQGKPFRYIFGSFLQQTGLSRLFTFRIEESRLVFSRSAMGLNLFMYNKEYLFESKRLNGFIKDGDTIVDIGANVGFMAIPAAVKYRQSLVIAVEPHPQTFLLLEENIKKNALTNIKYFNLAIGEKSGEICFSDFSNDDQNHVLLEGDGIKVKMKTLDELLEPITPGPIDLLKIDVEGYEQFVLAGAKKTIEKTAVIYIEIGDKNFAQFGYKSSDITNQLESGGFKVFNITENDHLERISAPFIQEKCINVIALKDVSAFCKNTGYTLVPQVF